MARNYSNVAVNTTLNGALAQAATTATISDDTGWPAAPFTMKCEDEVILVGARTGTSLSSLTRGYDGTTDVAHSDATEVFAVVVALDFSGTFLVNADGGTLTESMTILTGGDGLRLYGDTTGNANVAFMRFIDSADTNVGWVGSGGTGDQNWQFRNLIGGINLSATAGAVNVLGNGFQVNNAVHLLGTSTIGSTNWDNGQLKIGTSTTGMSIDGNEIHVNGGNAVIGTLSTQDLYIKIGGSTRMTATNTGVTVTGALTNTGDFAMNGTNLYSDGDWRIRRNGAADGDYYFLDDNFHRFFINGTEEFRVDTSGTIVYGLSDTRGDINVQGGNVYTDDAATGLRLRRTHSVNDYYRLDSLGSDFIINNTWKARVDADEFRCQEYLGFFNSTTYSLRHASNQTEVRPNGITCRFQDSYWYLNTSHPLVYQDVPTLAGQVGDHSVRINNSTYIVGTETTSTQTVKTNITEIDDDLWGMALINTPLKMWEYDNAELEARGLEPMNEGQKYYGWIAEDIQSRNPEMAFTHPNDTSNTLYIDDSQGMMVSISASLRVIAKEVAELEALVDALEAA